MPCFVNENIALCRGVYDKKIIGRTNKKWCFKCRGHFIHDKVVYSEVLEYNEKGELINGYYEPFLQHYWFPGRHRVEYHRESWCSSRAWSQ